jgi:multisubunit Na+/H+ antiporter MnhC subunit
VTGSATRRSTFGPTVLAGIAAATLAAVAGTRPWVVDGDAAPTGDPVPGIDLADPVAAAGEVPVALALGLVVLAAWGVLLVTRGRVRRAVAGLALLASAGLLAAVVVAAFTLPDQVAEAVREVGTAGDPVFSAWFWAAAVAAVVSVATAGVAVRRVPGWPEMGSRYDAPATAEAGPVEPEARSHLDLWKSMDEGHDPTA